jgi:hypothetical protein
MAKGICAFGACCEEGEVCDMPMSEPKNELPAEPGGIIEVGEGRTSLSLEGGSLRSVFQMAVPQGNVDGPWARPMTEDVECEPHGPAPVSAEGVVG